MDKIGGKVGDGVTAPAGDYYPKVLMFCLLTSRWSKRLNEIKEEKS